MRRSDFKIGLSDARAYCYGNGPARTWTDGASRILISAGDLDVDRLFRLNRSLKRLEPLPVSLLLDDVGQLELGPTAANARGYTFLRWDERLANSGQGASCRRDVMTIGCRRRGE